MGAGSLSLLVSRLMAGVFLLWPAVRSVLPRGEGVDLPAWAPLLDFPACICVALASLAVGGFLAEFESARRLTDGVVQRCEAASTWLTAGAALIALSRLGAVLSDPGAVAWALRPLMVLSLLFLISMALTFRGLTAVLRRAHEFQLDSESIV